MRFPHVSEKMAIITGPWSVGCIVNITPMPLSRSCSARRSSTSKAVIGMPCVRRLLDEAFPSVEVRQQSGSNSECFGMPIFHDTALRLGMVQSLIMTDKLRSYGPAKAAVLPSVEHRQQKYQNNRAENSHQQGHNMQLRRLA